MFEKVIESQFADPHGGAAELEEHQKAAAELLGANAIMVLCHTSAVTKTVMVEVPKEEPDGYKIVTHWRARAPSDDPVVPVAGNDNADPA